MKILLRTVLFLSLLPVVPSAFAGDAPEPCVPGQVRPGEIQGKFVSLRSGYYPDRSEMEGGFRDRKGRPLRTLQDYLKGKTRYVSVAMDHTDKRLPYGTMVRIPAVELAFHRCIDFRIVDTGGRFKGKGTKKIDICNDNREHAYASYTNGSAAIFVMNRNAQIAP